eukprot:12329540-Alexandrium_andersonii.AAC.1
MGSALRQGLLRAGVKKRDWTLAVLALARLFAQGPGIWRSGHAEALPRATASWSPTSMRLT